MLTIVLVLCFLIVGLIFGFASWVLDLGDRLATDLKERLRTINLLVETIDSRIDRIAAAAKAKADLSLYTCHKVECSDKGCPGCYPPKPTTDDIRTWIDHDIGCPCPSCRRCYAARLRDPEGFRDQRNAVDYPPDPMVPAGQGSVHPATRHENSPGLASLMRKFIPDTPEGIASFQAAKDEAAAEEAAYDKWVADTKPGDTSIDAWYAHLDSIDTTEDRYR